MFKGLFHRGWRGAVGLIAAYALVLQALLAYSIAAQAAATGDVSGAFFVICKTDSRGGPGEGGGAAPATPSTHCPICTLAHDTAGFVPVALELPLPHAVVSQPTPFVTAQACLSYHRARAGLTRAPPQNV